MSDFAWRKALALVAVLPTCVLAGGCGDVTATSVGGAGQAGPGLTACSGGGPVAAFLGGTEGEGFPGDAEGAPTGWDVWGIPAEGEYTQLTTGLQSFDPWISDDGNSLFFTKGPGGILGGAPSSPTDGWLLDLQTGEERLLVQAGGINSLRSSPDGQQLAYALLPKDTDNAEFRIAVADLDAPDVPVTMIDPEPSGPNEGQSQSQPTWGPDGRELAYIRLSTDLLVGRSQWSIQVVDLASGDQRTLYEAPMDIPLTSLEWIESTNKLLVVQPDDVGRNTVLTVDLESGETSTLAEDVWTPIAASALDGATVSAIGVRPEDKESAEPDLALMTWTGGDRIDTVVPAQISYAAALTVADCSYDEGAGR